MRIFISVGEPSGDLHGANLIRDLKQRDSSLEFTGFAGPKMQAAGSASLFDLTQLPVMFIAAAIWHVRTFLRLLRQADQYFAENHVDAVVLIDYPGFNWCVARRAKKRGIPVFYYGVPQMWAWAPWRIKKLRRLVDHVLCKLPFEPAWFQERKVNATYVGHPFYDEVVRKKLDQDFVGRMSDPTEPLLLLLPGSRNREVDRQWPVLRDAAKMVLKQLPRTRVAVACFSEPQRQQVQADVTARGLPFDVFCDRTPELIRSATLALSCSGSVSLELLAARLPTVIVYRVTWFQQFLVQRVLICRYITLVNLMDCESISRGNRPLYWPDRANAEPCPMPEYVFPGNRTKNIARRAIRLLSNPELLQENREWLDRIASRHAVPGASERAADHILNVLLPKHDQVDRKRAA